jgi:hypothetical protein
MRWGGILFGTGSRPNDIQLDAPALLRARSFFAVSKEKEAVSAAGIPGSEEAGRLSE